MTATIANASTVQRPAPAPGTAPDAAGLPFARAYGDWVLVSSGAAQPARRDWLPALPVHLEMRQVCGPHVLLALRGTAEFFASHVATAGDVTVVVTGAPLRRGSHRRVTAAELTKAALDTAFAESIWGQFCILRVDAARGSVQILTDLERSMSPWCTVDRDAAVALRFAPQPSITGAELDPVGAAEFLVHGVCGRDATPVRGWRLVSAYTLETWERGRVTARPYTHPIHAGAVAQGDPYQEFARGLADVVDAIARTSDRVLLPITGGIDSRLLLASLLQRGAPFESYTHGVEGCADAITVRRYLERAEFVHRFHAITPSQYPSFRSRVEGALSVLGPDYDSLAYAHVLTSYAAENAPRAAFLAGVGTGLHKVPYLPAVAMQGSRIPLVDAVELHYTRLDNLSLLRPQVAGWARQQMRASIQTVLDECPKGTRRVHAVQYYHLQERLGRWAGKGIQMQDLCGYAPCYPFLEPGLMQQSRRLGYARLHFGQKIIRALAVLEPRLLAIDNANGWPVVPMTPAALLARMPAYWRGASRFVYRKMHGRVAANIAIVDYRDLYRGDYREWMHELLDPQRSRLVDIVQPEALQSLLAAMDQGTPAPKRLGALAALELWARQ